MRYRVRNEIERLNRKSDRLSIAIGVSFALQISLSRCNFRTSLFVIKVNSSILRLTDSRLVREAVKREIITSLDRERSLYFL